MATATRKKKTQNSQRGITLNEEVHRGSQGVRVKEAIRKQKGGRIKRREHLTTRTQGVGGTMMSVSGCGLLHGTNGWQKSSKKAPQRGRKNGEAGGQLLRREM